MDFTPFFEETFSRQGTIMDLNRKFSDALDVAKVRQFKWTCIQLTSTHSYTEVEDNSTTDKVINVSVGRGTVGSFSIKVQQMEAFACLTLGTK